MTPPIDQITAQNYDMQFGTNVLGHLLFIRVLYSTVVSSTRSDVPSRIVWTSSSMQYYFTPPIDYANLLDTPERRKTNNSTLYSQSKFATVLAAFWLHRNWCEKDGVAMFVVDPGNIESDLQRHSEGIAASLIVSFSPLFYLKVALIVIRSTKWSCTLFKWVP